MKTIPATLAAGLLALTALTGSAIAFEDEDTTPADPGTAHVVFGADGTVTRTVETVGDGSFFRRLVAERAAGGSTTRVTVHGLVQDTVSVGTSRPTGTRYRRLARAGRPAISTRVSVAPDGRHLTERGYAVDVATGRVRRVAVDTARRLALDPRGGAPNTEYVYSTLLAPPVPSAG